MLQDVWEKMNMTPLVSILIPTYNRAGMIAETIESALAQTYSNIEVIVTDNASTDGTAAVVEEYVRRDSRVKFFRNEKNLGPVLNWKSCLDKASGEYAKILWSDDLMMSGFLEQTLALFDQNPDLAFVFTKVAVGESPTDPQKLVYDYCKTSGIYPVDRFVRGTVCDKGLPYSPGCAIFKTEVLRKSFITENDLFETRYLKNGAGPDLLMFLVAATHADHFGYVDVPLSFFRMHSDSITVSSNFRQLWLDYARAIIWFLYHYIGVDAALRFWVYVYKKRKLYRAKNAADVTWLPFGESVRRGFKYKRARYLLTCLLTSPERYLARVCGDSHLDFSEN